MIELVVLDEAVDTEDHKVLISSAHGMRTPSANDTASQGNRASSCFMQGINDVTSGHEEGEIVVLKIVFL